MVKVLHVYRTFYPDTQGGLEEVIRQVILSTKKMGVCSRVLTVSSLVKKAEVIEYEGIEVYRLPMLTDIASSSIPKMGFGYFKYLENWADVINYHHPWPFCDIFHFICRVKRPSVVTYHSDIVRQKWLFMFYKPVMRLFLSRVDRIVATSPNYLDTSEVLMKYKSKTKVVPIGIGRKSYPDVDQSNLDYWRRKFGEGFFFFVGVLRYYKGLEILINAAKQNHLPVIIAGDGPEKNKLRYLISKYDIKNVHLVGRISDLDKMSLLKLSIAFILPSYQRSEAFGVCLLEAQMMSKPLITTEIGSGMSYVNKHNETGLIVKAKDYKELSNAMEYMIAHPGEAKKFGYNGLCRFNNLFTNVKMAQLYKEIYFELANKYD